jgi:hypothetical protein
MAIIGCSKPLDYPDLIDLGAAWVSNSTVSPLVLPISTRSMGDVTEMFPLCVEARIAKLEDKLTRVDVCAKSALPSCRDRRC